MDPQKYYELLTRLYCKLIGQEWHLGYWLNASTLPEAAANLTTLMADRFGIEHGATVLDVGCGGGGATCYLARRYSADVIGLSNSNSGLREAERFAKESTLENRVSFRFGDAADLPFPDHHFDGVWSCEAIHNVKEMDPVIAEISRVLKPGGSVVLGDLFLLRAGETTRGIENYGFNLKTAGEWVNMLQENRIRVRESVSIGHHVGEQSLSVCRDLFAAEASEHVEGSPERVLCDRTVEATSRLLDCFRAGDLSWGIWSGSRE